MAKFENVWSDAWNLSNFGEERTFNDDRLFRYEEAHKVYSKFRKLAIPSDDVAGLSSLYWFDAVASQAVDIFARCPETYVGHARVASDIVAAPTGSEANKGTGVKEYSRGGTTPQNGTQELKQLLPIAAANLAQSCYRFLKRVETACGVDTENKHSIDTWGSRNTRFTNVSR